MATQYTEEFKNDSVKYWKEHPELLRCAENIRRFKERLSELEEETSFRPGTEKVRLFASVIRLSSCSFGNDFAISSSSFALDGLSASISKKSRGVILK